MENLFKHFSMLDMRLIQQYWKRQYLHVRLAQSVSINLFTNTLVKQKKKEYMHNAAIWKNVGEKMRCS